MDFLHLKRFTHKLFSRVAFQGFQGNFRIFQGELVKFQGYSEFFYQGHLKSGFSGFSGFSGVAGHPEN